ncbi:CaiB/BaiF CoA transferase family protein [Chloroflexota bacterium]
MVLPEKATAPLAALQVLDLANESACFCSRLLADMGARVVKIEKPGGDASRWSGPFWGNTPHPEKSLNFWYNNTSKLGITLNLESSKGQDIFLRLARRADVIVETFPPGYLKNLGLNYEVLNEQNPGLIFASVTGFGQSGPYRLYKSCDLVASALGGQMYVSGTPETPPIKPCGQQSYYAASLFAAMGILVALCERHHSGKGQHIDISLQEAVAATLEHVMVRYFYENIVSGRQGNLHWTNSSCLLQCQDGYILLTFDREWETLIDLLDNEDMAADLKEERWCEEDYRRQHADHIIEVLTSWTRTHTTGDLFEIGQLMRFPWAPVCSIEEAFHSPQLRARDFFVPVEHPDAGWFFTYPGTPTKLSDSSWQIRSRAPLIGEYNTQVYHDELGLTFEELARLAAEKVI